MTSVDLSRYRAVYAVFGLLTLPSWAWVAQYPDSVYMPPLGTARLFDGFPEPWVLYVLELLLAVSLLALLAGVRVVTASVVATAVMLVGYGFTYSLGKIDHNVLFILTPVALAAAGWSGRDVVRPLVLRLWAFAIGLAILSAGLAKAAAGWLDPDTQATYGAARMFVHAYDRGGWLSPAVTGLTDSPWLWEPLDVAAVLLECVLVLAVFSWRWFRAALAIMCLFHVGVLLLFGIPYTSNVVAYAAFVPWSHLRWPRLGVAAWMVLPMAAMAWATRSVVDLSPVVSPVVLFLGGAVGAWHLARMVTSKARGRPPTQAQQSGKPDVSESASQ